VTVQTCTCESLRPQSLTELETTMTAVTTTLGAKTKITPMLLMDQSKTTLTLMATLTGQLLRTSATNAERRSNSVKSLGKDASCCRRCTHQISSRCRGSSPRVVASYRPFIVLFLCFALPLLSVIGLFAGLYSTSIAAAQAASDFLDVAVMIEIFQGDTELFPSLVRRGL